MEAHELGGHDVVDGDASSAVMAPFPPADSGRAAWLFLTGCFAIETLTWGFPFSFGVLQDYYTSYSPISSHPDGLAAVGTTCSVSPATTSNR